MVGFMDMSVAIPSWMGAYQKAMDGEVDGLEALDENKAIDYADSIVRRSQSSGSAKDLAAIQTHSPLMKMFTMFYTYFSVLYNLFQRSGSLGKGRRIEDLPRFAASMFYLWFAPAVLSELVAGRGPDDDEDWGEWFTRTIPEWAFYPAFSVVGVRDVVSMMRGYGYSASAALDAPASLGPAARTAWRTVDQFIIEDDKDLTRADVRAVVMAIGYWGHMPARQMWITGEYLYDWMTGEDVPETPQEAARNLAYPRRNR